MVCFCGMNTVLLIHSDLALPALPLAAKVAASSGTRLVLLCVAQDPVSTLEEVLPGNDSSSALVNACESALSSNKLSDVAIYECQGPNLRRAALNALADLEAQQVILLESYEILRSPIKANLVRQIARAAPYDVLLLDLGVSADAPARIVFTQFGGRGEFGLDYAIKTFLGKHCPVIAIPDPQKTTRSARTFKKVQERLPSDLTDLLQQLAPAESIDLALRETTLAGDLVLFDADNADRVSRLLAQIRKLRQDRPDSDFSIGITRAAHAGGPGVVERALERFHSHIPKLDRDERKQLFGKLDSGGRLSADFVIMLMVSSAIAALGLIQNSTAVVIGGMLVAPLMTPLLAAGMALIQGNIILFRSATLAMTLGIAAALLCSMFIGLLSPWDDLSSQIVARGSPNTFDLGIAFLSGVAAVYALARPGLAGTLVGVAVAVALVPPLASVGIALVKLEFQIAFGAAILFTTNLLAIILGAALVFRFFGLDVSLRGNRSPRWVRTTVLILCGALLPTTAVLVHNLNMQIQEGVHRPYARPLPPALREDILQRVGSEPGASLVFMAHSDIEHGFGVEVVIAVQRGTDSSIRSDIGALVKAAMGENIDAVVTLVQAIDPASPGNQHSCATKQC